MKKIVFYITIIMSLFCATPSYSNTTYIIKCPTNIDMNYDSSDFPGGWHTVSADLKVNPLDGSNFTHAALSYAPNFGYRLNCIYSGHQSNGLGAVMRTDVVFYNIKPINKEAWTSGLCYHLKDGLDTLNYCAFEATLS